MAEDARGGEAGASCIGDSRVFRRLSTRTVPADIRLDYWRSHFTASRIEPASRAVTRDFNSEMVASTSVQGSAFASLRGDPITCYFGDPQADIVLLGCIRSGALEIRHGRGHVTYISAQSGVLLFDCNNMCQTHTTQRYAMDYLALPRTLARGLLGDRLMPSGSVVRAVPHTPLAASMSRGLHDMGARGTHLQSADARQLLAETCALGTVALARLRPNWRALPRYVDSAVLTAARHLLRQRLGDPLFTVTQLAGAMGCSRAHLYRLFDEHGPGVAGELREARLHRARDWIASRPDEAIGMIALHCGYTDLSAFGKAFRRRFGLTPSDWREQALERANQVSEKERRASPSWSS